MRTPKGLRLRSYPGDGFVTATFEPWPEHDNGFGFLNGGIIATVLDCHSGAAVFDRAHLLGMEPPAGRSAAVRDGGPRRALPATGPAGPGAGARAVVASADDDQVTVETELVWDGKPRAAATALWKRWRPR